MSCIVDRWIRLLIAINDSTISYIHDFWNLNWNVYICFSFLRQWRKTLLHFLLFLTRSIIALGTEYLALVSNSDFLYYFFHGFLFILLSVINFRFGIDLRIELMNTHWKLIIAKWSVWQCWFYFRMCFELVLVSEKIVVCHFTSTECFFIRPLNFIGFIYTCFGWLLDDSDHSFLFTIEKH